MSTDVAVTGAQPGDSTEILQFLGLDARDVRARALVALANRYQLDPIVGHLVMVDRKPYITRDGLLHVAHRSGQLDGIVIESGPTLVDKEWRCVVSVYRKDMTRPFTFPGRYPSDSGNRKYAPEMALKVAESMALRRAFDITGIASADEVDLPETSGAVQSTGQADAPQADAAPRGSDARSTAPEHDVIDAEIVDDWQAGIDAASTVDEIRAVWDRYAPTLDTPGRARLSHAMTARKEELEAALSGDGLDAGDAEPGETNAQADEAVMVDDGDSASPATRTDLKNLSAALTRAGITDRQDCLDVIGGWIGRVIATRNELTHAEAIKATLAAGQLLEAVAS